MAVGGAPESLEYRIQDALLQCAICLENLSQPKILPCVHTFCYNCLMQCHVKDVGKGLYGADHIQCPICRTCHSLPKGGVHELPTDHRISTIMDVLSQHEQCSESGDKIFCSLCKSSGLVTDAVVYCFTCMQPFCARCAENHDLKNSYKTHLRVCIKSDPQPVMCSVHPSRFVTRFCMNCKRAICEVCVVLDPDDHKHHAFVRANEVRMSKQRDLLMNIKKSKEEIAVKKTEIKLKREENDEKAKTCKDEIREYTAKLIKVIQRQEEALLACVDKYHAVTDRELAESEQSVQGHFSTISDLESKMENWMFPIPKQNHISHGGPLPISYCIRSVLPVIPQNKTQCNYTFTPNKFTVIGKLQAPSMKSRRKAQYAGDLAEKSQKSPVFDLSISGEFDSKVLALHGTLGEPAECRCYGNDSSEHSKPLWMTDRFERINRLDVNPRTGDIVSLIQEDKRTQKCIVIHSYNDEPIVISACHVHLRAVTISDSGQLLVTTLHKDKDGICTSLQCYITESPILSSESRDWRVDTSPGKVNHCIQQPDYVTTDGQGRVIISDVGHNVFVFDKNGLYMTSLFDGLNDNDLRPFGICVISNDQLLVALGEPCCSVCLFDIDGRFIRVVVHMENVPQGICQTYEKSLAVGTTNGNVNFYKM